MAQPTGGKLPFNSPYALHQLEAQRAYLNALAQVNQGRNSYLQQQGYTMGAGGNLAVNTEDPYSQYNQMQTGIGHDTENYGLNYAQGWGDLGAANMDSGVGGYQHQQFQQREGGIRNQFGHNMLANLAQFTQAERAAKQQFNTSKLSNKNALLQFLTQHQQFSKPQAVK